MAATFGIIQRLDFCVRPTRTLMPAPTNNFATLHQYRADQWIGGSPTGTTPGEFNSRSNQEMVAG